MAKRKTHKEDRKGWPLFNRILADFIELTRFPELPEHPKAGKNYEYWPEGDQASEPGVFVVDLSSETARLERPAGKDFLCRTTGSEMNALRDSISRMREESGDPPLSEEELSTEPEDAVYEWWRYYDHALRDLSQRHYKGEIPERGMVAWY